MSGRFALDRSLLNREFPERQWGNLGLWDGARDYAEACEALAVRLAEGAGLQAGSRVLDVGFGHGDQLLLWKRRFGVGPVAGVEIDPQGLAEARRRLAPFADVELDADRPWPDDRFDAVLALDCAYHFEDRQAFFGRARRALRPGGALALTDLVLAGPPGPAARRAIGALARACDIPPENLVTAEDYARRVEAAGLVQVRVERLDGVLDGFPGFVFEELKRRGAWPLSAGWARIVVSALAARWLARRDAVRYVLVTARRSP